MFQKPWLSHVKTLRKKWKTYRKHYDPQQSFGENAYKKCIKAQKLKLNIFTIELNIRQKNMFS